MENQQRQEPTDAQREIQATIRALTDELAHTLTIFESNSMKDTMLMAQIHGNAYDGPTVNLDTMREAVHQGRQLLKQADGTRKATP